MTDFPSRPKGIDLPAGDNSIPRLDSTLFQSRLDWFADFEHEFISQIMHCQVVSFDVFDTALIRRHAHPFDVFMEVETRAKSIGIQSAGFRYERPRAETRARTKHGCHSQGHEDPTLDEIYQGLTECYTETDCLRLKRLEFDVESENILANPEIYDLYCRALNKNCRVVFISDMYMDEKTIASWLIRSGYKHNDGIWVSSSRRHSKREGTLFSDVWQTLGVSPDAILHVGDNRQLDVDNAQAAGLRALHYLPLLQGILPGNSVTVSTQLGSWRHHVLSRLISIPPPSLTFDELGYVYGAPLGLAFIQWLVDELAMLGNVDLAFCARDGWLLRQIYELIRNDSRPQLPESCYLHISRQALCLPAISSLDDEMARYLLAGGRSGSIRELLKRIGLSGSNINLQELELDLEAGIQSSEDAGKVWQFLRRHENLVMAAAHKQRTLCESYFRIKGLLLRNTLVMVDLGWNASQQVALAEIFRLIHADCSVTGRYLGLYATAVRLDYFGLNANAFLVGPQDSEEEQRRLQGAVPLIESLFTAPHGSVMDYVLKPDGQILPRTANTEFERKQWPQISIFQRAVIRGVKDLLCHGHSHLTIQDAKCAFASMALTPSLSIAEACGELRHTDGVRPEAGGSPLADITSLMDLSPDDLRKEFANSSWKWGWLERLSGRLEGLPDSLHRAALDLLNSRNAENASPWDSAIEIMLKRAMEDNVTEAFIYGAGDFGVRIARLARSKGIKIVAFIDSSQAMQGRRVEALDVLSLAKAIRTGPHSYFTGSFAWAKHIAGIIRQEYKGTNLIPRIYSFDSV